MRAGRLSDVVYYKGLLAMPADGAALYVYNAELLGERFPAQEGASREKSHSL